MLKSTKIIALMAGMSLAASPFAAVAKTSGESLPPQSANGLGKKIDPEELEFLVASCELPGKRIGHYIGKGKGHPNDKGKGHSCDSDSPG